ncbi:MAG TPA: DUF2304 domain-containing protein [bacterium]|nr:DUF2304 domain-containing protein [bacterium]HPQ19793.1 DUF2304 domain-containing protein [bacterium]
MWSFIVSIFKLIIYGIVVYWLYDDAKSRDKNPFFWIVALIILVIADLFYDFHTYLFHLLIFIILYILFRPKGELIYCVECFKKKLETLKYCPHCFHIDEEAFDEQKSEETKSNENNTASENKTE